MIVALMILIVVILLFGAGIVKGILANVIGYSFGLAIILFAGIYAGSYFGEYGLLIVLGGTLSFVLGGLYIGALFQERAQRLMIDRMSDEINEEAIERRVRDFDALRLKQWEKDNP